MPCEHLHSRPLSSEERYALQLGSASLLVRFSNGRWGALMHPARPGVEDRTIESLVGRGFAQRQGADGASLTMSGIRMARRTAPRSVPPSARRLLEELRPR